MFLSQTLNWKRTFTFCARVRNHFYMYFIIKTNFKTSAFQFKGNFYEISMENGIDQIAIHGA